MKSNMYSWIDHTWNPLAGECPHQCSYCSTKSLMRYPSIKTKYSGELRLDDNAMKKNLGRGKTWFVCAQNDLFAEKVSTLFIERILCICRRYPDNSYVFQTKNPARYLVANRFLLPDNLLFGCTIETNRYYSHMGNAPSPVDRYLEMSYLQGRKFITTEPIMDFDVDCLAEWIKTINPEFVNIGADSKGHHLPEPSADKIKALIDSLQNSGIEIRQKTNLARLL